MIHFKKKFPLVGKARNLFTQRNNQYSGISWYFIESHINPHKKRGVKIVCYQNITKLNMIVKNNGERTHMFISLVKALGPRYLQTRILSKWS